LTPKEVQAHKVCFKPSAIEIDVNVSTHFPSFTFIPHTTASSTVDNDDGSTIITSNCTATKSIQNAKKPGLPLLNNFFNDYQNEQKCTSMLHRHNLR